jgi:hypothetical protein
MARFVTEALTYLDMGWAVYPAHSSDEFGRCSCGQSDCPCPGKHPVGRWMDYQNRLPLPSEVSVWFKNLSCNIGTITGQVSGIAVIDVDGREGLNNLSSLELPSTLTANTGGGGLHLFYSISGPVASRVKVLPGIDVRGDGGFVVLPPSLHNSGRRYQWRVPVAPLTTYDFSKLPRPVPKMSDGSSSEEIWTNELLSGVVEGSRSLSAAKLAGRYFGLGLTLNEVWLLMSAWNERNTPPLKESDLKRTVLAIQRKHRDNNEVKQLQTLEDIRVILKMKI